MLLQKSVRIFYDIIGEVITLLVFITFSMELSANLITFPVITFSGNYYILGCYTVGRLWGKNALIGSIIPTTQFLNA